MTLQIEAGKYYRTRDGRKVGPMEPDTVDGKDWREKDIARRLWRDNGKRYFNDYWGDLIAEWRDDIITHEGREYDLTALETPFGLLPSPVQNALKAWPHGVARYTDGAWIDTNDPVWWKSTTYRAKPAPVEVRVPCQRGLSAFRSDIKFGTCIKRADGSID